MSACIRGCIGFDQQPAEAERGNLCLPCSNRLRDHLGDRESPDGPHGLPWAWDALVSAHPVVATPASSGTGSSSPSEIRDPEADRLAAVLALRDEIRDRLASWTADVADDAGLATPAGITVSTNAAPAGPSRLVVIRCAAWLLRNVTLLELHPGVGEAWEELGDLMSRAHALAPWRPPPTRIRYVRCECTAEALHHQGDEVKCWACGASYDLETYADLCRVMLQAAQAQ